MVKPRILVTSAAGHTGSIVVSRLLEKGFPVCVFVRREDARSERLRKAGAEIFVGDLLDMRDLRKALADVQRAYYCTPFAPNVLHGSMLFALAAEEAKLEAAVILTAWNLHPSHPAIHQREHWMSNNIFQWMPSVEVVYVNPGLFAFTYFFGLPAAAHLGKLMLPYGEGLNAPPSNEDIASVAASVLERPRRSHRQELPPYRTEAYFRTRRGSYIRQSFGQESRLSGYSGLDVHQIRKGYGVLQFRDSSHTPLCKGAK